MKQTFVTFVLLVSAVLASAQAAKVQYVTLEGAPTVSVARGRSAPVVLTFTIQSKVHINSNVPSSETLIPTVLTLQPPAELTLGKLNYPVGHDFSFPFAPGEKLNVYTDNFQVRTTVRASRGAKPGEYHVSGILGYQACNDNACFPPKKLPVDLVVTVRAK